MPIHGILDTTNTWTGFNTLNTNLPTSTLIPGSGTQLVTKNFTDATYVDRKNNLTQDINGQKTFTSVPLCSTNPSNNFHLTNKTYCDSTFVDKVNAQNIGGAKIFSDDLKCSTIFKCPSI